MELMSNCKHDQIYINAAITFDEAYIQCMTCGECGVYASMHNVYSDRASTKAAYFITAGGNDSIFGEFIINYTPKTEQWKP